MLLNLRNKIALYSIKSNLKKKARKARSCNLKHAKTVAILLGYLNQNDFALIKEFLDFLVKHNIRIEVIAYIGKNPEPNYYAYNRTINIFTDKDINFFFKPKTDVFQEFITKKIDILINLDETKPLPLEYFAHYSKAGMKVSNLDGNELYDLQFKSKNNNLKSFLEEVTQYLQIITPGN